MAAAVFQRNPDGVWIASARTDGSPMVPGLETAVPLADICQGLTFPEQPDRSSGAARVLPFY